MQTASLCTYWERIETKVRVESRTSGDLRKVGTTDGACAPRAACNKIQIPCLCLTENSSKNNFTLDRAGQIGQRRSLAL
jgi:hypothetical protein